MQPPRPFRAQRLFRSVLVLTFALVTTYAQAQLRLPSLNLPLAGRLGPLDSERLRAQSERLLGRADLPPLQDLRGWRLGQVEQLLRRHPTVLETDPRGQAVVRREILAWSPSAAGLAAAKAAGLRVLREKRFDELDQTMLVLGVPDKADIAALLETLRAADPDASYDFNHIYLGGGASGQEGAGAPDTPGARSAAQRVGLVDSGVDTAHAVFAGAAVQRWGCDGSFHPASHGTAVAALMVGKSAHFQGVAPGAQLYAADIYCDSASGGSADKIAAALAWMAKQNIGVINLSIVGPPNQTLARTVAAMLKRGHVLVAAVGNDGPAAPPLYPASYPGVVGVSAVDRRGQVLPEAARGPQVMFAAPGKQMVSASTGAPPYRPVRGTSFASPIVAALLAGALARPDPLAARAAIAALAQQARRDDPATVSYETGYGIVGAAFRVDPSAFK